MASEPRTTLAVLEAAGIALTVDGEDLIARPTPAVTPGVASVIKANKTAIIETLRTRQRETRRRERAAALGLVACWSRHFSHISIHDPTTGEWHDLQTKDAPEWAVGEARRRKELYRDRNRRAYRLTSREMEEIWREVNAAGETEEGIVEEHPVEED